MPAPLALILLLRNVIWRTFQPQN